MRYLLPFLLLTACDWDQYQCDNYCDLTYAGECGDVYGDLYSTNPSVEEMATQCHDDCAQVSQISQQNYYHCVGQSAEEFKANATADQEYPECYGRWSCGLPSEH